MKILISTFTFSPNQDGIAEASGVLARAFLGRGWSVEIATEPSKPPRSLLDWNGAIIHQFSVAGSTYFRDPFRGDLQNYRDFLSAGHWDVIIFQGYFWPLFLALDLLDGLPSKKVLVSHGTNALIWVKTRRFPFGLVRLGSEFWHGLTLLAWGRKIDRLVFYSSRRDWQAFFDRRLASWMGHPGIVTIPNGVEIKPSPLPLGFFRNKHGIPPDAPFFLCVANYSLRKDQGFAVRAFRQAAIPNAHLVLIGSNLNEASAVFQAQDSIGAAKGAPGRVHWLEKIDRGETLQAISECDVFVLSASHEGQPFAILEAMAQEKPWIARQAGCVDELPGGICIHSLSEMAQSMRKLATDKDLRRQLGGVGQAAIRSRFLREHYIERYCQLVESLASAKE